MKQLELYLGIGNVESIAITYNEKVLLENLRSFGEKILGGFAIDEALEKAYIEGAKVAALNIGMALAAVYGDTEEDF